MSSHLILYSISSEIYTYVQPGTRPNSQTYACNLIGKTSTDLKPSPFLTFLEMLIFVFFGQNSILIDCVFFSCETTRTFCKEFNDYYSV